MALVSKPSSQIFHLHEEVSKLRKIVQDAQVLDLEDVFAISEHLVSICEKSHHMALESPYMENSVYELLSQAESLLCDLEEIEKRKIEQDRHSLAKLQQIIEKAQDIDFEFVMLTPSQILEEVHFLTYELKELFQKNFYHQKLFVRLLKYALEKINYLQFRLDFPILEELSEFSFQNTFARRILLLAEDLQKERKKSLTDLTEEQKERFYAFLTPADPSEESKEFFQKLSSSQKAFHVLDYLHFLQKLSLLAQRFAYGNNKKAYREFLEIPESNRLPIEQYFWRIGGKRSSPELFSKENSEMSLLMARAMMAFISEAILG